MVVHRDRARAPRATRPKARSRALLLTTLLGLIYLGPADAALMPDGRPGHSPETQRILAAIEARVEDKALIDRVRDKCARLGPQQARLLASLADRVAASGQTPAGDVAFLMLAVLIVWD